MTTYADMTIAEIIHDLRGLLDAATPGGEWRAVEGDLEGKPVSEYARTLFANREGDGTTSGRLFLTVAPNPIDPELGAEIVPALTGDGPRSEANALLIAAAVNALPTLLDDLEAARADADKLRETDAVLTIALAGLRGGVQALADRFESAGCDYRHQQGSTDECNACTAADFHALLADHTRTTDTEGAK